MHHSLVEIMFLLPSFIAISSSFEMLNPRVLMTQSFDVHIRTLVKIVIATRIVSTSAAWKANLQASAYLQDSQSPYERSLVGFIRLVPNLSR